MGLPSEEVCGVSLSAVLPEAPCSGRRDVGRRRAALWTQQAGDKVREGRWAVSTFWTSVSTFEPLTTGLRP